MQPYEKPVRAKATQGPEEFRVIAGTSKLSQSLMSFNHLSHLLVKPLTLETAGLDAAPRGEVFGFNLARNLFCVVAYIMLCQVILLPGATVTKAELLIVPVSNCNKC